MAKPAVERASNTGLINLAGETVPRFVPCPSVPMYKPASRSPSCRGKEGAPPRCRAGPLVPHSTDPPTTIPPTTPSPLDGWPSRCLRPPLHGHSTNHARPNGRRESARYADQQVPTNHSGAVWPAEHPPEQNSTHVASHLSHCQSAWYSAKASERLAPSCALAPA